MSDAKGSQPKQTIRDYIGNMFAALLMLAFVVAAAFVGYVYLTDKGIDITEPLDIPDAVIKLSVDCEALKVELQADVLCRVSDDCTFTRDELEAYRQRKVEFNAKCDPDLPL